MKTKFLLFSFCFLFYALAQAQWTTVKKFSGEGNLFEIDSTGIYVQNGNQLFLKNDTANWKSYPINGKVNDMLLLKGKLFYTFSSYLYQYSFGPKPIRLEDSAWYISAKGKDIIFYTGLPSVKKYIGIDKSEDLLKDYNKGKWPDYAGDFKYASDDSIIIIGNGTGSGRYLGGHIYKNKNWFSPSMVDEDYLKTMVNSISIVEGKILGILGKGCYYAYYSANYGKSEKIVDIQGKLNYECWGNSKILAFKNSVFLTTKNGVYATDTSFKKWDKILLDSNIVDAQVWGTTLYVLTSKATLLSYDLNSIIANTENENSGTHNIDLQYSNGMVYNKSNQDKSIIIKSVIGKTIYTNNLSPQSIDNLELTDGIYFLYQVGVKQKALKIYVVN